MPDDALRAKVIEIALQHSDWDDEDLLDLLEYEWDRAGLAVADRGEASDYLRSVITDLWQQARRHRGPVDVIVGMSADHALQWASLYHPGIEENAFIIGLIAAGVTHALLRDPGDRSPRDDASGDGTSPGGK